MGKYEVLENKLNSRKDKRSIKVALSKDESIFLNLSADPTPEKIDAEVEVFLANRSLAEAQKKADDAKLQSMSL